MEERVRRWQLESLIAVGGLGEVWRATSRAPTRSRSSGCTRTSRATTRRSTLFAVEQQLATTLPRHPNVVHGARGRRRRRPPVPRARARRPARTCAALVAPPATQATRRPRTVAVRGARDRDRHARAATRSRTSTRTAGSTATSTRAT